MDKAAILQFRTFLRSGLSGEKPDNAILDEGVAWDAVYNLAKLQTVTGFVTDGIDLLKGPLDPFDETFDPFLTDLMSTEKRNDKLNSAIPKIIGALEREGLRPVMVKGQVLAKEYRFPTHRQCGDIDLLLTPEDYSRAREILIPKASKVDKEYPEILHQAMKFGSIELELHGAISTLMSPALDRKLAALQTEMFAEGAFRKVEIGGMEVSAPPVWFDAVYIFVHMQHHYWSMGVGLRQILDWAVYVTNHYDEIDMPRLDRVVSDLGMKNLWRSFASFAADFFDLPADRIPFYTKCFPRRNRRILRYVIRCGNFGKNLKRKASPDKYFFRKVHSFFRKVFADRLRHILTFACESLRYFFGAFRYGVGRLSKGE